MKHKHLLCIYPWLALGGADKFNLDMLGELGTRGWRATIVTTLPSAHAWRDAFGRVCDDIVDLAMYAPEQQLAVLLSIALKRQPDTVLISNSALGYRALPYLRAHLPNVTFVDYCHMEENTPQGAYPGMSVAYRHALDLQIVSSEHLKQWMVRRGGNADRIAVCTTNIDINDWNPARYDRQALRAALRIPPDTPVALYACRLEQQKQPIVALDVMRVLARQHPTIIFLIVGDGQFAPYVRGFIKAHHLEQRIRFFGPQPNIRVRELLALSDVFFLPSEMEGISLAIYEAMAMGVAPVSADVGGQAELVTPDTGVLIKPGPQVEQHYIATLNELFAHPQTLVAMGRAARARVATGFRIEQMGERMEMLLAKASELHSQSSHPPITAAAARASAANVLYEARQAALLATKQQRLRRSLHSIYRWAIERGAWWLVPPIERVRAVRRAIMLR